MQIRNVSPDLHRKLTLNARKQGLSLSAYLIQEFERVAALSTLAELAERIWQLLFNLTAFDAAYVALAEALALLLYTRDARLSRSARHQADIKLV